MTFDEVQVGQTVRLAGSDEPWLVVQKHAVVTRYVPRTDPITHEEAGETVPVSPEQVELSSWSGTPNTMADPASLTLAPA